MRRLALIVVWVCAGCAARAPARTASGSPVDACSSVAASGLSAAAVQRMEHASNVLEYENIWRGEHPGSASGTTGGAAVRASIRSKAAEIRSCYESALDKLPQGGGRVVVRFVIGSDGRVPMVSITSNELRVPEVGCCVVKHVAEWTFERPTDGGFAVVEYPFVVRTSKSN